LEKTGNLVGEIPTSYETFGVATTSKIRAYLKIQDGCNNFCSYCLIPYVRGRSRSRELSDIVCEAKELDKFNKEIILTGINISDYRIDGKLALATLMNSLSGLNARIRISSLEVNVITPELLEVLKSMPNFCPQFHLSMQSGCDRILRLMNRRYTSKEFLSKVELIRSYFPNAGITTDVIVGFPTETDEDFSETVQTIKKANFFEMHIFPYSKRDGTVASKMKMVDGNVVKSRVCELEKINQNAKQNYILSQSKNILTVLTENTENGYMVGHTENYIKIYLPQTAPRHEFVKITNLIPFLDGAKAEIVKS
jgi:threonylcarbamoyladenosine tRNA methylthiotransferase MtaB